jgi:hypothetical protein
MLFVLYSLDPAQFSWVRRFVLEQASSGASVCVLVGTEAVVWMDED